MSTPNERFEELLPWFIQEQLEEGDRDWMSTYLRDNPEARKRVEEERTFAANIKMDDFAIPIDEWHDRFMAQRSESEAHNQRAAFGSTMRHWLEQVTLVWAKPALAGMAAILIMQTTVIGMLMHKNESQVSTYRSTPDEQSSTPTDQTLEIYFKPEATDRDIRALLWKIQGTVIGGPGQFGPYLVMVSKESVDAASTEAEKSAVVDRVNRKH